MSMSKGTVGLIGLAVMGENLALNLESKGYKVVVYNRTASRTEAFLKGPASGRDIVGASSLDEMARLLPRPRQIILMVKAGRPVDEVIEQLLPLLEPGDILIDGGNSHFEDTERRAKKVEEAGLLYVGTGISGGEEGALKGPSIMPGGSQRAWCVVGGMLKSIAAKAGKDNDEPCCEWIGPGGAGHYVKMVHNGIEYVVMQAISEAYLLMSSLLSMRAGEIQTVFDNWNKGDLDSYLMEIAASVLKKIDPETGRPLVDVISDRAAHKGTGMWTSQSALELGVPAPSIAESVMARYISSLKAERESAAKTLPGPTPAVYGKDGFDDASKPRIIGAIHDALKGTIICAYAQGFAILAKASETYSWQLNMPSIAALWRGGCIIRAAMLADIMEAFDRQPNLPNLLVSPVFRDALEGVQKGWRAIIALAAQGGVPVPCFASSLSYYDSYRAARLGTNLVQAQRDYFGAHTYERVDREGVFHTDWTSEE